MTDPIPKLVRFFESLTPEDLDKLDTIYAANARFKDPFNEVQGIPAIRHLFAHMFVTLHNPRFIITRQIAQGHECFLVWEFRFRFKRFHQSTEQVVRGGSHVEFNEQGLVSLHRDYWDAAEELYEKIPVIGSLMRWLKRQANN